jgi:hypothetical protein
MPKNVIILFHFRNKLFFLIFHISKKRVEVIYLHALVGTERYVPQEKYL